MCVSSTDSFKTMFLLIIGAMKILAAQQTSSASPTCARYRARIVIRLAKAGFYKIHDARIRILFSTRRWVLHREKLRAASQFTDNMTYIFPEFLIHGYR